MASTDNSTPGTGDHSNHSTISATEPKRKVSILTDPPTQERNAGYDNLAYEGVRRKISQVRIKSWDLLVNDVVSMKKCLGSQHRNVIQ